jgi:hypothetical protein
MKSFAGLSVLASAALVGANKYSEAEYDSGKVHEAIMEAKFATWDRQRAAGAFDSEQYPSVDEKIECIDGLVTVVEGDANNTFRCNNVCSYPVNISVWVLC